MNREHWERIGALFDEALERSGAERDEFLSNLGEEQLEDELRSLLSAHESRGPLDDMANFVTGPEIQRLLRLAPGESIGPYRIVREIASGGMATVYLAQDLKHERQVAIKVLGPTLVAVLGADRFDQEIMTTARLQHPHILPLLDSGQEDGLLYYVMPYIEGESLRDRLDRETQLGVDEAIRIAVAVAEALDYAHRNGVVHRDIKPGNILLHDGRPMVADFGIALAVSKAADGRTTEAGLLLGTQHYMSPEQATAERELTHRSDIYSLGCVLYEMLTGEPPHTGTSAQQIIRSTISDDARPVTDLRKSVPRNVSAATAMSLEKLPADRFESALDFAEALEDPTFATPTARVGPDFGFSYVEIEGQVTSSVDGAPIRSIQMELCKDGSSEELARDQTVLDGRYTLGVTCVDPADLDDGDHYVRARCRDDELITIPCTGWKDGQPVYITSRCPGSGQTRTEQINFVLDPE